MPSTRALWQEHRGLKDLQFSRCMRHRAAGSAWSATRKSVPTNHRGSSPPAVTELKQRIDTLQARLGGTEQKTECLSRAGLAAHQLEEQKDRLRRPNEVSRARFGASRACTIAPPARTPRREAQAAIRPRPAEETPAATRAGSGATRGRLRPPPEAGFRRHPSRPPVAQGGGAAAMRVRMTAPASFAPAARASPCSRARPAGLGAECPLRCAAYNRGSRFAQGRGAPRPRW